jgi:hypothetical protein
MRMALCSKYRTEFQLWNTSAVFFNDFVFTHFSVPTA